MVLQQLVSVRRMLLCKSRPLRDYMIVTPNPRIPDSVRLAVEARAGNKPLPGSELSKLLAKLGFAHDGDCGCSSLAVKMDAWGPAGCREHMPEIVAHLRERFNDLSRADRWRVRFRALIKTNPWTIEGLVRLAIKKSQITK